MNFQELNIFNNFKMLIEIINEMKYKNIFKDVVFAFFTTYWC